MSGKSPMDWTIEPARPGDEDAIAALIRTSFDPLVRELTIFGCAGYARYVADWVRRPAREAETRFLVARREQAVLGFLELRRLGRSLCINDAATDPAARGRGVYRDLLRCALERGDEEGYTAVILDVFEGTPIGGWYEELGFRVIEETAWRRLDLPDGPPDARASVAGLPQADCAHDRYGFSMITVRTPAADHSVGRLGDRWYRATQAALLNDLDALRTLARLDPRRSLLWIGDAREATPAGLSAEALLRARRMESALEPLLGRLDHGSSARGAR